MPDLIVANSNSATVSVLLNTTAPGATRRALTKRQMVPLKRFAARLRKRLPGAVPDFDPFDGAYITGR